jgi:hypothetical protein
MDGAPVRDDTVQMWGGACDRSGCDDARMPPVVGCEDEGSGIVSDPEFDAVVYGHVVDAEGDLLSSAIVYFSNEVGCEGAPPLDPALAVGWITRPTAEGRFNFLIVGGLLGTIEVCVELEVWTYPNYAKLCIVGARSVRQYVIGHVGGNCRHAARVTRWAHTQRLAREGDESLVATVRDPPSAGAPPRAKPWARNSDSIKLTVPLKLTVPPGSHHKTVSLHGIDNGIAS